MKCPYCGTEAIWTENKIIYGRNYGRSYMVWYCQNCGAFVGCHNNTRDPLGTMANAELREWRKKAHAVLDPLWRSGGWQRKAVYSKLKYIFGHEIHIGESDIQKCQNIIGVLKLKFVKEEA